MGLRVTDLQNACYLITWLFLSINVMKVAGISHFNHLKCINLFLYSLRFIFPVTLLYKLQSATEKVIFRTNELVERLVLWYEFNSGVKLSHMKLHILKEKYSHTIIRKDTDYVALTNVSL